MARNNFSKSKEIGRKISLIRELRGMKQETLAKELGISQQAVSRLEKCDQIDCEKLEFIAKALNVSADAICNFNEDAAIFSIKKNLNSKSQNGINECEFNPLEKMLEVYDALLKCEREKNVLMEKLLKKRDE